MFMHGMLHQHVIHASGNNHFWLTCCKVNLSETVQFSNGVSRP